MKKYIPGIIYLLGVIVVLFFFFKYINMPSQKTIVYHTVSFDLNGGTGEINNQLVQDGLLCGQPYNNPQKENHVFAGWYLKDDLFDFSTPITNDIMLVANYTPTNDNKVIIISFNTNSNTKINNMEILPGQDLPLPNLIRDNYTFKGWSDGNKIIKSTKDITSNITLNAIWEKKAKPNNNTTPNSNTVKPTPNTNNNTVNPTPNNNTPVNNTIYTIIFNSNGGSAVASQKVKHGNKATMPNNPTKDGYIFDGWYIGNDIYYFSNPVYSNLSLTAHWIIKPISIPTLNYTNNSNGKFVFINNPEWVKDSHLADSNKTLFYKDSFNGTMELYYEHHYGEISNPAYYVIRFFNPGTSNVTLTVNKSGISTNDSTWTNSYRNYYSQANITKNKNGEITNSFTIGPNEVLYFYHNNNSYIVGKAYEVESLANKMKSSFDGVLNVTASNTLQFAALGYTTSYVNTDGATYNGNVEEGTTIAVYSGYYNKLPDLYNDIQFEINETIKTGEYLKVKYNNNTYSSWITNSSGAYLVKQGNKYIIKTINETYKNDMINLKVKTASGNTITIGSYPEYKDSRPGIYEQYGLSSRSYNIANWAVHYHENITIKNSGTTTRKIVFRIKNSADKSNSPNCNSSIIAITPSSNLFKRIKATTEFDVWNMTISPGETKKIPAVITLGGDSCGTVEKYLYVSK